MRPEAFGLGSLGLLAGSLEELVRRAGLLLAFNVLFSQQVGV